jgi:tellurite methyltransferase
MRNAAAREEQMPDTDTTRRTDTAHLDWDEKWKTEEGRKDWLVPEEYVVQALGELRERGARKALDLGCGVGRHAFLLAEEGFETYAYDGSPAGIAFLSAHAGERGLGISTVVGPMTDLPYESSSMDFVLAWNVIYHGDTSVVLRTVSEVLRVLAPGGLFLATMLSKRNGEIGEGRLVALNTYVGGEKSDKAHPHFYCDSRELLGLLGGFEILSLRDRQHNRPGSFHWEFLAEKRKA